MPLLNELADVSEYRWTKVKAGNNYYSRVFLADKFMNLPNDFKKDGSEYPYSIGEELLGYVLAETGTGYSFSSIYQQNLIFDNSKSLLPRNIRINSCENISLISPATASQALDNITLVGARKVVLNGYNSNVEVIGGESLVLNSCANSKIYSSAPSNNTGRCDNVSECWIRGQGLNITAIRNIELYCPNARIGAVYDGHYNKMETVESDNTTIDLEP